ncbi:MAG: putative heme-binding domain-containing protein [Pirellulaceae bacterium]|jgi:putative heme-binding domain-containing protein
MNRVFASLVFCQLLLTLVISTSRGDEAQDAKDELIVQTLMRLESFDVNANAKVKEAVHRYLKRVSGTEKYIEIVKKLNIDGIDAELFELAIANADESLGVAAAEVLLKSADGATMAIGKIVAKDDEVALSAIKVLGLVGNKISVDALLPLVTEDALDRSRRNAIVSAIGKNRLGQLGLLKIVTDGHLPKDVQLVTASALHGSSDAKIREQVAKHLKLPSSAGSKPLPPIGELVSRKGDAGLGKKLFADKATCLKCHKVAGEGKEVGPDLSEIGSKLSKEAMYVSILDPSAGVSHNYETYSVILLTGNVVTGILVSQTDESLTVRTAEAITKTIDKEDVDELIKQKTSLMPSDLQKLISVDELVSVVEFLATLKKKN